MTHSHKLHWLALPVLLGTMPALAYNPNVHQASNQLEQASDHLIKGEMPEASLHIRFAKQFLILNEAKYPLHTYRADTSEMARKALAEKIFDSLDDASLSVTTGVSAKALNTLKRTEDLLSDYG